MWTIFKGSIRRNYWLIFLLVSTAYGSPYYYREDKHQSEHHKEYSYKGQPSPLNPLESAPQKYYDSSHFSSYGTPERYYKLETSPTFSSGFSQYSGGQTSYHQSSGISGTSGHLLPLATGKSINVEGIHPGTYVIKQVKIYGNPSTFTSHTGYYGSSSQNGQLEGRGLETVQKASSLYAGQHEESLGQKEESLYKGQHEVGLNEGAGGYVKQHVQTTSLYHQLPQTVHTVRQGESLYGQKLINIDELSGQKEDSLYSQPIERGDISQKEESPFELPFENFDPKPERGDLVSEQVEEDINKHNFHLVKPIQLPVSDGQGGYKYYEKRVITYGGAPAQESNVYKQTYGKHESTNTGLNILGNSESLYGPTATKLPIGNENTGSKHQTEHIRYSQERVIAPRPQATAQYPVFITTPKETKIQSHAEQQSYTRSLEVGQQEESFHGQHSEDIGQQLVPGSLELGQPEGQQLVTGSLELGPPEGQQLVPGSLELGQPEGQQLVPGSLEFGQPEGQQLVPGSLEFGQPEGQQLVPESLEFGQPGRDRKQLITGVFETGQKEGNTGRQQTNTWQKQVNTSTLEISGQRTKPTQGSLVQLGNAGKHVEIERLDLSSHNKPNILVKQNVTRTLIIGHSLPVNPSLVKPQNENVFKSYGEDSMYGKNIEKDHFGQKEESLGQLETGILEIGQHEETLETGQQPDLLVGQKEVDFNLQIPEADNLELGQKEESSFDLQQGKGFPYVKPTKQTNQHETKTYNHHESYYNEFKQTQKKEQKNIPMHEKKPYLTTIPSSINRESIEKNHRTNYLELQRKAEELALQLGLGDNSKEKPVAPEKVVNIKTLRAKESETTTSTTEAYAAEVQELGLVKHHLQEVSIIPEKKLTAWETHKEEYGLNYPLPSRQTSYSSKKHTKHSYVNQDYPQPMSQNYGYQGESQHSTHGSSQQGYLAPGGTYFNDQPIQKSHTSGSQFSFSSSSSGSSQDKHQVIDEFLKELDKDIARTNYQQRQQQGSYAQITPTKSEGSGVSYYSQKTVSSHSSTVHSSGGTASGDAKSWYQRIGDSIGTGYNQAKDKAKEIVKTVKESVGYTNS